MTTVPEVQPRPARSPIWLRVALSAFVFMLALGVRVAYREDLAGVFEQFMPAQSFISHRRAVRILEGGGLLLWEDVDPTKLRQIRRPPGYPVFLAAIYSVTGPDLRAAQLAQAFIDALAAALLVPLGAALLSLRAGVAGGLLYAFSPHLALYSVVVTPDAPASWPTLAGVALVFVALRPRGLPAAAAGVAAGLALGLSCWLTAQGVLLPAALALVGVASAARGARRQAAICGGLVLIGAALAVAPITARNVAIYGSYTPIRPGLGTTLIEGLGVYDPAFPATDEALLADEAARFGRPDYGQALYQPDGALRERDRIRRALEAIAGRPLWFGGIMLDRMGLMLTYDHSGERPWPANTAVVGPVLVAGGALELAGRAVVATAQRLVFRTWLVRLLVAAGLAWLIWTRRWRTAALLGVVPAYHLALDSLLLTEYKYALPIHAWLFLFAGVGAAEAGGALVARALPALGARRRA
jgi:hypothetical protein